ncbi:NAD-dependent succinate-semialdehyde dehydrogenase [Pseudomonas sp. SCB32]|uniref:NAD-dependent succinate-semialdehyde dehydrogenase n=1 Tax=Pseudomonas sp. SCB32 TaxID=2653853 RepID=UPI0012643682|nr:NAD-dependent succinate-semialdehyde dehydrogenase [Pseudomonas sp. SCB32]
MKNLAKAALEKLRRPDLLEKRAYIDGQWIEGETCLAVVDPATSETIAQVAHCSEGWIDKAVDAATEAFESWRDTPPAQRGAILRRWAALTREHSYDLAIIMTAEQGKPFKESLGEIAYGANFLEWFAAEAERSYGESIPSHLDGSQLTTKLQPIGVTAAITPWNFPSAMITRKAGAALAAGCPMIVKPAPETPLSALALAKLGQEAGIPAGVFQVVTGDAPKLSARLLQRTEVRAFSFTGSTQVGRILLRQSAETVKKVSLELGGHAPFIVFDDSSIEEAVQGCIGAKFATSGQDCLAANRIYVQRSIYEPFVKAFAEATAALKVGHGLEEDVDIGPMTRVSVANKCRDHIGNAISLGARVLTGGMENDLGSSFVSPTVLADVTDEMDITFEETFGPVAAVLPFDTEDEVVRRANDTEYGLAAYVYTNDLRRAARVSDRLEYGMVALNTPKFTGAPIPFGGWKQSGLGREGSRHGLAEYMELKYVCVGGL